MSMTQALPAQTEVGQNILVCWRWSFSTLTQAGLRCENVIVCTGMDWSRWHSVRFTVNRWQAAGAMQRWHIVWSDWCIKPWLRRCRCNRSLCGTVWWAISLCSRWIQKQAALAETSHQIRGISIELTIGTTPCWPLEQQREYWIVIAWRRRHMVIFDDFVVSGWWRQWL